MGVFSTIGNKIKNVANSYVQGIKNDPFGFKYQSEKNVTQNPAQPTAPVVPTTTQTNQNTPFVNTANAAPTTPTQPTATAPTTPAAPVTPVAPVTPRTATPEQLTGLNAAYTRIQAGTPGAQDQANIDYATKNLGYTPGGSPVVPTAPEMITGYDPAGNPVQVERGKYVPGISLTPPATATTNEEAKTTPTVPVVDETPAPGPYETPEYKALQQAYADSLKITPEEEANQESLNTLNASLATGTANIGNQPIPMGFITGQQASVEKRALALEQPLQAKAALLQSKRIAAQDASKFMLEQEAGKISEAEAAKAPVAVGAGTSLIDPKTGEPIYTPPTGAEAGDGFTLSEGQKRFDAFGNEIASAPKSPTSENGAPTVKTINGSDYQWDAKAGQWSPLNLSSNDYAQAQKTTDQISFLRGTAEKALKLVGASGASGIVKELGDKFVGDTKFRQLEALTDTLRTNVLTLVTDPSIKKFFGPQMSEADVRLMTAAGTTLNVNSNSPEQMKYEINRLTDLFNRIEKSLQVEQPGDEFDW